MTLMLLKQPCPSLKSWSGLSFVTKKFIMVSILMKLRNIIDPKEVHGEDFPDETFRVLKEKEVRLYGEYRTSRLVLDAWDGLAKRD